MEPEEANLTRAVYILMLTQFLISWAQSTVTCPGYVEPERTPCPYEVGGLVALSTPWYCVQCQSKRPSRSRHCHWCRACVREFDHHCPWIQNCCGRRNHGYFIKFCLYAVLGQLVSGWALYRTVFVERSFGARYLKINSQALRVVLGGILYAPAFLFTIFPAKLLLFNLHGAFHDVTGIERIAKVRRPFRLGNFRRVCGKFPLLFLVLPGMKPIGVE